MKNTALIIVFLLLAFNFNLKAQKYFVSFADKGNNIYSIEQPDEFLSQRSIERRSKQNIEITEDDLPVSQMYLDSLKRLDLEFLWASKWLNGAIVQSNNQQLIDTITNVSFISGVRLIWEPAAQNIAKLHDIYEESNLKNTDSSQYGLSEAQTTTVNGHLLHDKGYEGQGMMVAVLDNGYQNVNSLSSFEHLRNNNKIIATRDFVNKGGDVYGGNSSHGTMVLSVMAGLVENSLKGSAPKADYVLLRSEDDDSEYVIEEYNWVIAAEFADSIGADVINSSLGYYYFDDSKMNYSHSDLDGKTSVCVFGAEKAFSKGMLVVASAGNEGDNDWRQIITPADGENVLAVGAALADSTRSSFSSFGPSADGRIKPDVVAVGTQTAIQRASGQIGQSNGTSFSSPVIAGFATCLWQAKPNFSNSQILYFIKASSHKSGTPDNSLGYGFPNFNTALSFDTSITDNLVRNPITISPNPFFSEINISFSEPLTGFISYSLYDINGHLVKNGTKVSNKTIKITNLQNLKAAVYILKINYDYSSFSYKIIKI